MKHYTINGSAVLGFYLILCFLSILYPCRPACSAEKIEITTFDYSPFMSSKIIPGKGNGFGVDITKAAFQKVGIEPEFKFSSIKRNIVLVTSGESYANLGTISHFKDAAKKGEVIGVKIFPVNFIFYYFRDRHGILTYNSLSDLKPYTIGNVRGSATTRKLTQAGLKIDWASSIELNFKKFFGGRFDLCVGAELTGDEFIQNHYPDKFRDVSKISPPILTVPMSMNFLSSHSSLAERFRQGMEIIKADGTFVKIIESYFGKGSASKLE